MFVVVATNYFAGHSDTASARSSQPSKEQVSATELNACNVCDDCESGSMHAMGAITVEFRVFVIWFPLLNQFDLLPPLLLSLEV